MRNRWLYGIHSYSFLRSENKHLICICKSLNATRVNVRLQRTSIHFLSQMITCYSERIMHSPHVNTTGISASMYKSKIQYNRVVRGTFKSFINKWARWMFYWILSNDLGALKTHTLVLFYLRGVFQIRTKQSSGRWLWPHKDSNYLATVASHKDQVKSINILHTMRTSIETIKTHIQYIYIYCSYCRDTCLCNSDALLSPAQTFLMTHCNKAFCFSSCTLCCLYDDPYNSTISFILSFSFQTFAVYAQDYHGLPLQVQV